MTSRLIVTQTNGHITMRWSANVGTTSKTASTVYGIRCLRCKGKWRDREKYHLDTRRA
uniref:Uncharacterized protein n=1 Tax=Anguilla anguilla TaxID=7936 RepID=A0A0E9PE66_ANGAN